MSTPATVSSTIDVATLAATSVRWWLTPDELTCLVPTTDGTSTLQRVPSYAVNASQPGLWDTLRLVVGDCIFRFGQDAVDVGLIGELLRGQIALLQYPTRTLQGSNSRPQHVSKIFQVYWRDIVNDITIGYWGSSFTTQPLSERQPALSYVLDTRQRVGPVTTLWLDHHYPGWKDRCQMGVALGYSPSELAEALQLVVPSTPGVSVVLPSTDLTSTY